MVRSAFGSRLVMARLIHVGFPWNALATGLRLKPGRRDKEGTGRCDKRIDSREPIRSDLK